MTDSNDFTQAEPKHPDYAVLDRLVLKIGSEAAQEGFDPAEALRSLVDPQSVVFVGIGKACAFLGVKSPKEMQARLEEIMVHAMFWVDGVHHGIEFERAKEQA